MAGKKQNRYSAFQKSKLQRQFESMLKTISPILSEKYGEQNDSRFQQLALSKFRDQIVPKLPYIGGNANPYMVYLQQTAMALAIYEAVKECDGSLEQAGEIIYKGMALVINRFPKPLLHLYGRWVHARIHYPTLRKKAIISQRREFPADWVYEFIEGDGQKFTYGIDMRECGIVKFLESMGAPELAPWLCAVDYVTNHAMGIELQRSETLVAGCDRCNFRFIVSGTPLEPSWPPVFPERENCPSK